MSGSWARRRHARTAALAFVGTAITFASGSVGSSDVYLGPLVGLVGIALVLMAVGMQLLVILEGESHARRLASEVDAGRRELAASEERFRTLVETSSDVIWIVDSTGMVTFVTPSSQRVLGYESGDCVGSSLWSLVHKDDVDLGRTAVERAIASEEIVVVEWRFRKGDGSWAHVESTVRSLLDDDAVQGVVVNSRDISERKALEAQLIRKALHDPLTGLANGALLRDRITLGLARSQRGAPCALLLVDLDDFKAVNDTLGHAYGDRLLGDVAARMRGALAPGDLLARLGGDEFAVLPAEAC
ncbi:MAG TPA: diguanylate cyclase, partial [Acidimicrobiales bacterium]